MPNPELDAMIEATSMGGFWRTEQQRQELDRLLDTFLETWDQRRNAPDSPKRRLRPLDKATLLATLARKRDEDRGFRTTRAAAFMQAVASGFTMDFLVMTWLLVFGDAHVDSIDFAYRHEATFEMTVVLRWDDDARITFASNDVYDVAALRHMGILKIGHRPVLDGFSAMLLG